MAKSKHTRKDYNPHKHKIVVSVAPASTLEPCLDDSSAQPTTSQENPASSVQKPTPPTSKPHVSFYDLQRQKTVTKNKDSLVKPKDTSPEDTVSILVNCSRALRDKFNAACKEQDIPASRQLRTLIRNFIADKDKGF